MIKILKYSEVSKSEIFAREESNINVEDIVADIIEDVRKNGDKALFSYCEKFDKAKLESLEVSKEEIEEAFNLVEPRFIEIIKEAAENIKNFHEKQVRNSFIINDNDGIVTGQKVTPIEKVGLYVPGGTAAYPSTVLMDSIPAKIAGCSEIPIVIILFYTAQQCFHASKQFHHAEGLCHIVIGAVFEPHDLVVFTAFCR